MNLHLTKEYQPNHLNWKLHEQAGLYQSPDYSRLYYFRTDKKGYSVIRNVENNKNSGIPKNNPLRPATVCRICKTLEVVLPDSEEVYQANHIIELAHRNHSMDRASNKLVSLQNLTVNAVSTLSDSGW
jgi:hypothetical protein